MRRRCYVALLAMASALPCACGAAVEQGGRDVTVALFTTGVLRSVTIAATAPGAWTAACARCSHQPLTAPLVVSKGEVYAGGDLRVADTADTASAAIAAGLWHVRGTARGVDVVLTMPSERYTAAVVSAEADAHEPEESLRALAIVARTYALNGPHYNAGAGHLSAELCASTQCQALRWGAISAAVNDAVRATAGETLWFRGARAEVFFSQHCGGVTADASEVWGARGRERAAPYLRSHADLYCLRHGPAAWHATVSLEELGAMAQQEGWHLPARVVQVNVAQRSGSGRVARLVVRGAGGESSPLSASALRFGVGRALGWNRMRSDWYEVAVRHGALMFDGRGHGHGVGLCQAGATEMAAEHHDAGAILEFYFPGTRVRITANDEGWMETRIGALRVSSTAAISSETRAEIMRAWQGAIERFPVGKVPEPVVIFAPSTEMYRQMTGLPGWDRASTRGNVVTLQPERILRQSRTGDVSEERTLQHEFLHVLIESEATDRAPLWLREGLAEARSTGGYTVLLPDHTGAQLDSILLHADSWSSAMDAHVAAGARVLGLIHDYGFSTVRGWLKSGVPASVAAGK